MKGRFFDCTFWIVGFVWRTWDLWSKLKTFWKYNASLSLSMNYILNSQAFSIINTVEPDLGICEGEEERLLVTQNYLRIRFRWSIIFFTEIAIRWVRMRKILQINIFHIKYKYELDPALKKSDYLVCFSFLALSAYASFRKLRSASVASG